LEEYIQKHQIQVAVLVETHLPRSDDATRPHPRPPFIQGMNSTHVPHTTHSSGVAVYVNKTITSNELSGLSLYSPYTTATGNQTAMVIHSILAFRTDNAANGIRPVVITA